MANQQMRVQLQPRSSGFNFEENRRKIEEQKAKITAAQEAKAKEFPTEKPEGVKKSIQERILSFTGGNILGRSGGLGIAQFGTKATMDEIQQGEGEMQQKLIQKIRENKAAGKDTTRLTEALKALTGDSTDYNDLYTEGITTKQGIGDAAQLAATAATGFKPAGAGYQTGSLAVKGATSAKAANLLGKAGIASNVIPKVASPAVPGILQGALQGAKTGAMTGLKTGLPFGAATGVSQGLKENKSVVDSLKQGAVGAVVGGATGGILGGTIGAVTGGVSGGLASRAANKTDDFLNNVTPKVSELTPKEYERLLNMGKIAPKTATQPARYILSDAEKATAIKYKDLISSKDPVKNTINVMDEIARQDDEVEKFLTKNNGIFNGGQLKNHIINHLDEIDDVTVDKERLRKAILDLTNNFIKSLEKKDMKSLWSARKAYDAQIEKAFGGSPTLTNKIKTEFRNSIQDFISQKTPDTTYANLMKEMSQLFRLRDILNTKAAKEKTHSALSLWMKHNPGKVKLIGYGLGATATGLIGANVLGGD